MRTTLTDKQIEILRLVSTKNVDGSMLDLTQLRNALSYTASKQAILSSVKHLIERSLIERTAKIVRKGYVYTTLSITGDGEHILRAMHIIPPSDDVKDNSHHKDLDEFFASDINFKRDSIEMGLDKITFDLFYNDIKD